MVRNESSRQIAFKYPARFSEMPSQSSPEPVVPPVRALQHGCNAMNDLLSEIEAVPDGLRWQEYWRDIVDVAAFLRDHGRRADVADWDEWENDGEPPAPPALPAPQDGS